ncbi:MAG: hypothetical protein R3C10_13040 [Pirellulales bacterium]
MGQTHVPVQANWQARIAIIKPFADWRRNVLNPVNCSPSRSTRCWTRPTAASPTATFHARRDCPGPSGETIDFSVTGTIVLTLGELVIDKDLTIDGPGAELLTIDASGQRPDARLDTGRR